MQNKKNGLILSGIIFFAYTIVYNLISTNNYFRLRQNKNLSSFYRWTKNYQYSLFSKSYYIYYKHSCYNYKLFYI